MRYYEVFIADGQHHGQAVLTYSSEVDLAPGSVVTVPVRQRMVTGFVTEQVKKPGFATKPVRTLLSDKPLPPHCLALAHWMQDYYCCTMGEALRQFAPSRPTIRKAAEEIPVKAKELQLQLDKPLTNDQKKALKFIKGSKLTTTLLHGDTGTGKTRVYLELAKETLAKGHSVTLLTPEIALTSQLAAAVKQQLQAPTFVLHSQLSQSQRKKIWLAILEAKEPVVIIGPRSALFSPISNLGLIVLDEAHEPSYKQDSSPRYHAARVASQLGVLTDSKVVLGTATPSVTDYYLADQRQAVVKMSQQAAGGRPEHVTTEVVDIKDRTNFPTNPYLSKQMIDAVKTTLSAKKQVMIYLNRRGSARIILCNNCGWQLLCPNCDVPLVYHGDEHLARCHICGHHEVPPIKCPQCGNHDIIYKSIGTKALMDAVTKLFPDYKIARFDSDNLVGERIHEVYDSVLSGEVDILVGTQLLAKGLDLPKLGMVGIVAAESSLALPDYTAEERTFQLLYQVIGRVGRGHGKGVVVVQSYEPDAAVLKTAVQRDWHAFYLHALAGRRQYRFPPFSYLLKLTCRRSSPESAEKAANRLKGQLLAQKLPVEIMGPAAGFYGRRGNSYNYQLVIKSKSRDHLVKLARSVPADWTVDLDPANLL